MTNIDKELLINSAKALLALDASNSLVPHGIGGLAKSIIQSFIDLHEKQARAKQHSGEAVDNVDTLEQWLVKNMPAGTVIGDPIWWANKINNVLGYIEKQHSGEAVAFDEAKCRKECTSVCFDDWPCVKKLAKLNAKPNLSPQQPQGQDELVEKAVAEALEKAAKICDDNKNRIQEQINTANPRVSEHLQIRREGQVQASEDLAKAIRALITNPTQEAQNE